jgi:type II secretory pathway component GspD/PulD (secretin)
MRGYPDRNLILLRGKPDDIAVVRRIIMDFDVPAPQARLTLWSFEISAEVRKPFLWIRKPADNLNEATAIVDKSLGKARGEIAGATTSLRESVN